MYYNCVFFLYNGAYIWQVGIRDEYEIYLIICRRCSKSSRLMHAAFPKGGGRHVSAGHKLPNKRARMARDEKRAAGR